MAAPATATRHDAPPAGYTHERCFDSGYLPVSDIHSLYYEQYGKRDGKPVIYLHGGPGSGTSPGDAQFFDPKVYRVVLLDQRGAGKSTPTADLRDNTSQHLVEDLEMLRMHLRIEQWHMVFGGSWGSTLALLYSQAHPESVGSLVIFGIWTMRRSELAFMHGPHGAAHIFPEEYEDFSNFLPAKEREDVYSAYYKRVVSSDQEVALAAADAWNRWDLACSTLIPDHGLAARLLANQKWSLQHAKIEIHYELNGAFMGEGQILKLESLEKITQIPCMPL